MPDAEASRSDLHALVDAYLSHAQLELVVGGEDHRLGVAGHADVAGAGELVGDPHAGGHFDCVGGGQDRHIGHRAHHREVGDFLVGLAGLAGE